ncbi:peptide ABC transporter substrate-binding protein [Sporosarcina sp. P12(2017)]|uniref:ABC transporter substrate-binding protein n=1 Tax=unclassified Sporosarcina TaxID=2647733 RepID=UPI000C16C2EF|nr:MULTISPECIES: ABC transporter substrate-binding protein [unclassified Sporosarcina]PIC58029.1 peptide ABC transporter substrate-binding protein [Sporosarcina sp. P10]PIC59436.1 peptide ABC transporter substrate-binding protein [Sporosarcina sp. P12(2017)]
MITFNKRILVLFMVLAVIVAGCSKKEDAKESTPSKENRLIYASEEEFEGLNPILEETNLDALLFRGVMRFDESNKVVTDIAESFDVSEDKLTYTFKLKEGITFHDGEELTADDVVFTIESIMDDQNASFLKSDFEEVATTKTLDDYTVEITLKQPFTPLLDKLTVPILPKHAFEGIDMRTADFNGHPIGAGPYMFDKWDRGNSLTLQAYSEFFGTKPSIEKVIFKFIPDSNVRALQLKSGEVDVALLDPVQVENLEREENLTIYDIESADYRGILFNMNLDLWKDVNVRRAFSYATDREQIVKGILKGHGSVAYSPLQNHEFRNEQIEKYTYDLEKANALLDEAGWKENEDGIRSKDGEQLSFTITAPASDTVRVNMANYVAEGFKDIGADVKVAALDWSAITIEDADAFMVGWGSPYDADHHTHILFHTDESSIKSSGYNYGSYSNKKVDELLAKGRTETDPDKRKAIYMQFQEELANDPAFDFIAYENAVYGINKNVSGVKERTLGHHGSGFLWNVEEWKWNDQ